MLQKLIVRVLARCPKQLAWSSPMSSVKKGAFLVPPSRELQDSAKISYNILKFFNNKIHRRFWSM